MGAIARAIAANPEAVSQVVKVASSSAAGSPVGTAVKVASSSAGSSAKAAVKSAQKASSVHMEQGIAKLLAEKIVELFGGDHSPANSTPVASEPTGIQQLFGFAF
jgi:hypothetical protein